MVENWSFLYTENRYKASEQSIYEPVDVYECPHCGAKHRVAYRMKATMPFCWKCEKTVKPGS